MKVTDYAPRAAPFDSHLMKLDGPLTGIEIGVDVGAHAQAMLEYCNVRRLSLVDPWPNPYCRGYCEGRLAALGFMGRVRMMQCGSLDAVGKFADAAFDFIYIDQEHDAQAVGSDLRAWWPKLRGGGVLGYRNYSTTATPLKAAVDAWIGSVGATAVWKAETGEIVVHKMHP